MLVAAWVVTVLGLAIAPVAAATSPLGPADPPPFDVAIAASPHSGGAPLEVDFAAAVSGGTPPLAIDWSFGDGATAEGWNTSHTFISDGRFQVQVHGRDAVGAVANAWTNITVGTASPTTVPIPWTAQGFPGWSLYETFLLAVATVGPLLAALVLFRFSRPGTPPELIEAEDSTASRTGEVGRPHRVVRWLWRAPRTAEPVLPMAFLPCAGRPSAVLRPPKNESAAPRTSTTEVPNANALTAAPQRLAALPLLAQVPTSESADQVLDPSSDLSIARTFIPTTRSEGSAGVVWLRSQSGRWERVGTVPWERVGHRWVQNYRRVNGLGPQSWVSVLPRGQRPTMLTRDQASVERDPPRTQMIAPAGEF